jgi:hypothetical protein
VELSLVECKLLTLEDVPVAPTRLTRPAGDDSVQPTSLELLLESRVNLAPGCEPLCLLLLNRLALLHLLLSLAILGSLGLLTPTTQRLAVVCLVPLAEGGSIDLHDGRLGEGVGSDELVVRRVVGHDDDTGLASATFRCPGKVARIETQGTVLVVAAAGADDMDALRADTGVGTLAAGLESSLLPC